MGLTNEEIEMDTNEALALIKHHKTRQADINLKVMFRQCGIGYDKKGNPIYNRLLLLEWFEAGNNKKNFNEYDTI